MNKRTVALVEGKDGDSFNGQARNGDYKEGAVNIASEPNDIKV